MLFILYTFSLQIVTKLQNENKISVPRLRRTKSIIVSCNKMLNVILHSSGILLRATIYAHYQLLSELCNVGSFMVY